MKDQEFQYTTSSKGSSRGEEIMRQERERMAAAGEAVEPEAKNLQPQPLTPWTDEDLDAMTDDLSEDDVKAALASRGPQMRNLLEAKQDE